MHFFKKCALIALTALLTASVLCHPSGATVPAADGKVRFDSGEWIFLAQASGSHTVEITDNSINASIGTLLCPGANGTLCIGIVNDGQHSVNLSLTNSVLHAEAPLQIELSGVSLRDDPIVLAPGETCFLHVTVRWDPESTAEDVDADGSFAIALFCDGEEAIIEEAPGVNPQTGDPFPTVYIVLATASLVAILLLKSARKRILNG